MEVEKFVVNHNETWVITLPELLSKSNFRKGQAWTKHKAFHENTQIELTVNLLKQGWNEKEWNIKEQKIEDRPISLISLIGYSHLDADNALKSIQDCMQNIFFYKDSSVAKNSSHIIRKKTSKNYPVIIGITNIEPKSNLQKIKQTHNQLDSLTFNLFLQRHQ